MASSGALRSFLVVFATLAALSCLAESTNWLAETADENAAPWRFNRRPSTGHALSGEYKGLSKFETEVIRSHQLGEDDFGPIDISVALVLYASALYRHLLSSNPLPNLLICFCHVIDRLLPKIKTDGRPNNRTTFIAHLLPDPTISVR